MVQVLVVDDERDVQEAMKGLLEDEGFVVRTCATGEQALGLLEARKLRPDLMLLDLMLPRMSGHELLRAIRQEPSLARVPVVVMSAVQDAPGLEDRTTTFLRKPFSADRLLELVQRLMEHTPTSTQGRRRS